METKLKDGIIKTSERLFLMDVEAIKKSVYGASELSEKEILEVIQEWIALRINYLKSVEGFDLD